LYLPKTVARNSDAEVYREFLKWICLINITS
jgi:hypothetical protein